MADLLLCEVIAGQLHHSVIIAALSSNSPILFKDVSVHISEFIPHFLAYLRERLTQPFESQGSSSYYSPRQREELRKRGRNKIKAQIQATKVNTPGARSARVSLRYASSSPVKKVTCNVSECNSTTMELSGISPIKNIQPKRTKQKKVTTMATSFHSNNSRNGSTGFELSSMDDFPSMMSPTVSVVASKNPRRITTTPVGTLPCVKSTRNSNHNSSHIASTNSCMTKKESIVETTSFLEESSFEVQNANPSFESLFQNDKRFSKSFVGESSSMSGSEFGGKEMDLNSLTLSNNRSTALETTPTKQAKEVLDLDNVDEEREILNVLSEIYAGICASNLVPNLTLELYFLFTVLTTRVSMHQRENAEKFLHPFTNIECLIYFAVACLEKMRRVVFLLDGKSLQLLFENSRVQQFTSVSFLEEMEKEITADTSADTSFTSALIKSPITGIAFQTESDNRKSFASDRHFYSFSKKRDAFYSLVREWEENYSDPDWNLSQFLVKKVNELMKNSQDGINNHFQFARLFVAQLLEMCRCNFHDKTDEPETSDDVLLELKKRYPHRFQSLQERLTKPSFSCDPCPKLTFSKVEEFFKEFIIVADSYCFNKCLSLVLLNNITSRDSKTFGLNRQINVKLEKSDFSETLWQDIKSTIQELRLLAKFLGFVLFLPYQTIGTEHTNFKETRELLAESLSLQTFLKDAFLKHRLLITIPWTVDFLSMTDKDAFNMTAYSEALNFLTYLYRYMNTRLIQDDDARVLLMSLTLHIGWLFDQHPSNTFNFYETVCSPSVIHFDSSTLSVTDVGLDDIIIVDKLFLYSLCPYLKVIKRPLDDFKKNAGLNTSGTFRKITPLRSTDVLSVDVRSNLKAQLLDGFLKYTPNHVTDCIKYVTDRFFMNIKHHITEVIFPTCQNQFLDKVKEQFLTETLDEEINKDNLKLLNKSLYNECLVGGKNEARSKCQQHVLTYLDGKIESALQCLLPEDTDTKLVQVSSKVVRHNVCNRVQEWLMVNRDLYNNGFDALYNRHVNHVIKAKNNVKKKFATGMQ